MVQISKVSRYNIERKLTFFKYLENVKETASQQIERLYPLINR